MSIGNSPEDDRPSLGDDDRPSFADDARPSIGHVLKQARIAAGLTVDEVSSITRVRIPIVHGLEDDDFSRCGGDVYARGHIRTVARAVGLDPEPLVAQYDAEHGGRPAPTPAAPMFEAERIRPERRRPNWTAAMVAAIVAVVAFVGFTMFNGSGDSKTKDSAVGEGPTQTETHQQSPAPKPPTSPPAAPRPSPSDSAIAAAPQDKVTVKLSAISDKSWISAKAHDGKVLYDGLLEKGESKTFVDGDKIDLILGNAGAIELYVNGKKVEDQFGDGQVERLTYTKGDPVVG
ncbi:helix-turn-helix domain-containing protein [Streptomyces sp. NPDC059070]|uniref:helix-turn-helix domain-containing protein n=1 Tax=unclassified Streptomyces TaxID=2593676 RepID=UPI0034E19BA8